MTWRALWFAVGLTALLLAMVGVLLPLLPTVPFVLVAAFAFARSSERARDWLHQHQVFGPMIESWLRYGAISRPARILAVASLVGSVFLSFLLQLPPAVIAVQSVVLAAVATFILTRPLPPPS